MSTRKIWALGISVVLLVASLALLGKAFEYLDARQVMVIQYPTGTLVCHINPGIKLQAFGTVTKYKRRDQLWFSAFPQQGKKEDESIAVRFNDGGHAKISGSIAWEMPLEGNNIINLNKLYGSHYAIEHQLIKTLVEKAVYMTGPLMSSKESYAEKRNDLLNLIDDQLIRGVYKTETKQVQEVDTMTGAPKTVSIVKIVMEGAKPARQDKSPLEEFSIKTFNLSINAVSYDKKVEDQIQQQQQAIMQVQTAVAEAKKAQQRAITVSKEGEADAAKAKWDQEVIKAKFVTEAQQQLEVARLNAQAAEQTKRQQILLGEGEAARKRLVMEADGALEPKLKTLLEINKAYAEAMKEYQGNWVPTIVMGGATGAQRSGSGAQEMIDLLTAHTARQLGVDLGVIGMGKTAGSKKSAPAAAKQTNE